MTTQAPLFTFYGDNCICYVCYVQVVFVYIINSRVASLLIYTKHHAFIAFIVL